MMNESCPTLTACQPSAATVDAAIKTLRNSADKPATRPVRTTRAGDAFARRDDDATRERAIQSLSQMGMGRDRAVKFIDLTEKMCAPSDVAHAASTDVARMMRKYFPYSHYCP